jgi:hypothetical protein
MQIHRNLSEYFTKYTLLLIYCAFIGINHKTVHNAQYIHEYILFSSPPWTWTQVWPKHVRGIPCTQYNVRCSLKSLSAYVGSLQHHPQIILRVMVDGPRIGKEAVVSWDGMTAFALRKWVISLKPQTNRLLGWDLNSDPRGIRRKHVTFGLGAKRMRQR